MGMPSTGSAVPMIFTSGPGSEGSPQVLAAGSGSSPSGMLWITEMSVPTFPGFSGSSGFSMMRELPGPPNWLNPNSPSWSFRTNWNSRVAVAACPSEAQ